MDARGPVCSKALGKLYNKRADSWRKNEAVVGAGYA
jgi:hypothetical protein